MHEPSAEKTAFSCPHCGALTTQYWYSAYIKHIGKGKTPFLGNLELEEKLKSKPDNRLVRYEIERLKRIRSKQLFSRPQEDYGNILYNLNISKCYNCDNFAIWISDCVVYPPNKFGSIPNQDLPENVLRVVEEARAIIDLSPKGAAALLRLSIQMLCEYLGGRGKDLNEDIASLVKRGLSEKVKMSLDIVRVIGNEAVHPGVIDLNDNKDIAVQLFSLVNIIADQMITQPKQVNELYQKLPESKLQAIEARDGKAPNKD